MIIKAPFQFFYIGLNKVLILSYVFMLLFLPIAYLLDIDMKINTTTTHPVHSMSGKEQPRTSRTKCTTHKAAYIRHFPCMEAFRPIRALSWFFMALESWRSNTMNHLDQWEQNIDQWELRTLVCYTCETELWLKWELERWLSVSTCWQWLGGEKVSAELQSTLTPSSVSK